MEVKLEKFSGPLELLLQLIEERRLEVTEVSLAEVTDQYIEYVRTSEIMMEEMADFLVVASKLLLIKSRALLPSLELSRSEEEEIHDFTLQLQEYQRYREAMQAIQQFVRSDQFIYTRPAWSGLQLGFFPPSHLEVKELGSTLENITASLEAFLKPFEERLIARTVSIEEKIQEVLVRVEKKAKMQLEEFARGGKKVDIILAFLALLFLFKEKVVTLVQSKRFGDIAVTKVGGEVSS